jgi:hypothetical protein
MIQSMLNHLENELVNEDQVPVLGQLALIDNESNSLLNSTSNRKSYQPVLKRPVRDSVQTKIDKFQNKQVNSSLFNET